MEVGLPELKGSTSNSSKSTTVNIIVYNQKLSDCFQSSSSSSPSTASEVQEADVDTTTTPSSETATTTSPSTGAEQQQYPLNSPVVSIFVSDAETLEELEVKDMPEGERITFSVPYESSPKRSTYMYTMLYT